MFCVSTRELPEDAVDPRHVVTCAHAIWYSWCAYSSWKHVWDPLTWQVSCRRLFHLHAQRVLQVGMWPDVVWQTFIDFSYRPDDSVTSQEDGDSALISCVFTVPCKIHGVIYRNMTFFMMSVGRPSVFLARGHLVWVTCEKLSVNLPVKKFPSMPLVVPQSSVTTVWKWTCFYSAESTPQTQNIFPWQNHLYCSRIVHPLFPRGNSPLQILGDKFCTAYF